MVGRVFVLAVPWRALLVWRTNAWCMTGALTFSAKITLGSRTSPWRAPAESKRGTSRGSVGLGLALVQVLALRLGLVFPGAAHSLNSNVARASAGSVCCSCISHTPRYIED